MILQETVKKVVKGVRVGDFTLYAKKVSKGRFPEEVNLDIYLKGKSNETHLLYIKVYKGWGTHYRPWVEFSGINSMVTLGGDTSEYFDSAFEDKLLRLFSASIPPGGKIYVEYSADKETGTGLLEGFPAPVTRLGYKLFLLGFTWFKDWYFPEGGREGGEKLEGEKPLNKEARKRHLREIRGEVKAFLGRARSFDKHEQYVDKAVERGKNILDYIRR